MYRPISSTCKNKPKIHIAKEVKENMSTRDKRVELVEGKWVPNKDLKSQIAIWVQIAFLKNGV